MLTPMTADGVEVQVTHLYYLITPGDLIRRVKCYHFFAIFNQDCAAIKVHGNCYEADLSILDAKERLFKRFAGAKIAAIEQAARKLESVKREMEREIDALVLLKASELVL